MRRVAAALALCTLAMAAPRATANEFSDVVFEPQPGAQLPLADTFRDEQGRAVTLQKYFAAAPVVLVLEYLRCTTLCGVTLQHVIAALAALPLNAGRDFQFVAVSIDPRDRPADADAARTKYLAAYRYSGDGAGLHFLVGTQESIRTLADAAGFHYRYDKQLDQFIHPAGFLIATPDGRVSRALFAIAPSTTELRAAIADAAQGRTPGVLTRLLLLCHVEGLPVGRYEVPVMAAFALANLGAMAGLVALFVAIRRRPQS